MQFVDSVKASKIRLLVDQAIKTGRFAFLIGRIEGIGDNATCVINWEKSPSEEEFPTGDVEKMIRHLQKQITRS